MSRRSEVVFNSMRELLPKLLVWLHLHRRYSHPFRIILTPSATELAITFRSGIEIAYVSTIRNRHSETVDRTLDSWNFMLGPKFHLGACVLVHRLSYPLGKKRIFVRTAIRTACESPIQNRHFDPVGTRFSCCNVSLDHVNPGQSNHTESACHGDQKLCSTQRENSCPAMRSKPPASSQSRIGTSTWSAQGQIRRFPVRRPNFSPGAWSRAADAIAYGHPIAQTGITFRSVIGIAYKTSIRNRHSKTLGPLIATGDKMSFRGRKTFILHSKISILDDDLPVSKAKQPHGVDLSRRSEVVFNSARELLPRSLIWVYEHRRYSHPFRDKTGHNFPPGYRNRLYAKITRSNAQTKEGQLQIPEQPANSLRQTRRRSQPPLILNQSEFGDSPPLDPRGEHKQEQEVEEKQRSRSTEREGGDGVVEEGRGRLRDRHCKRWGWCAKRYGRCCNSRSEPPFYTVGDCTAVVESTVYY
ncbi:hypothetical protein Taro_040533 [Colocasia esculenta]|uniref:Uncharacterized protein n=1 Tax=Colocasia esculenta TaxID=4460 RepID=A0A843WJA6_COLES|nr:hypothetical protein [Colocasia esculenta]